ncbi:MAG TPA: SDR family NAD(P)-dependent oxidoreductase, partial [Solirubrobacterales bacterium]
HAVIAADLAGPGAAEELVARAGDLDGLVANAALPATGRLESLSSEEVQRALRVNFESPILMARALAPKLAEKGEGHLVFIASLSGKVGSHRSALYNSTKFGLRGFAFGLREDLHPHGVGVSIVSPGFVREAGMFADASMKPPPGLGTTTPEKVAKAVVRAIRRNRNEITVAPRRQRFIAEVGYRHPELAAWMQRRGGAERHAEKLAAGQSDKR